MTPSPRPRDAAHASTSARRAPTPEPAARSRAAASGILPSAASLFDLRGPYFLPLLLLLSARVALWISTRVPAEDAFITFRYARSLATGQGLVYNPGEHVMGFTSPLWTVWTALGVFVTRDAVVWARAWGVIADAVTLLVAGGMLEREFGRRAAWSFTLFFAAWPYFSAVGVSGMEMSLCMALLVLSAALVQAKHPAAGPALAALALTRPEGAVAAVVLSLGASWRDRLIALAIVGAAAGALTLQFGSPIPNSLLAKAKVYGTPGPWAGRHWWEWLSPVILGRWPSIGDTSLMIPLTIVASAAFASGLAVLWRERRSSVARAAAAAILVWAGYAFVGAAYFWWYFSLPLLGLTLACAVGLPRIVRGPWIPVSLAALVLSVWTLAWQLYVGRASNESRSFGTIAARLADRALPGQSVLLEPIGMIGYTAPLRVLDETGLVTPAIAKRRLQGPGWYTDVVAEYRPDWIVIRSGVLKNSEAFAGVGRPFRNSAERDSLVAHYPVAAESRDRDTKDALLLLQRAPDAAASPPLPPGR